MASKAESFQCVPKSSRLGGSDERLPSAGVAGLMLLYPSAEPETGRTGALVASLVLQCFSLYSETGLTSAILASFVLHCFNAALSGFSVESCLKNYKFGCPSSCWKVLVACYSDPNGGLTVTGLLWQGSRSRSSEFSFAVDSTYLRHGAQHVLCPLWNAALHCKALDSQR